MTKLETDKQAIPIVINDKYYSSTGLAAQSIGCTRAVLGKHVKDLMNSRRSEMPIKLTTTTDYVIKKPRGVL